MIFPKIPIKTKLLVPMLTMTLLLLYIGSSVSYINYNKLESLKKLRRQILLANQITSLIHSLQTERGLSCAFIFNEKSIFEQALLKQRKKTDFLLNKLKDKINDPFVKIHINNLRKSINNYSITYNNVIKFYSYTISDLLDILIDISKKSHIPIITQDIIAHNDFLFFKEYMGIERALGVVIFSQKNITKKQLIDFTGNLTLEKYSKSMFLKYATPSIKLLYLQNIYKQISSKILYMQKVMLYKKLDSVHISPEYWLSTMTLFLNNLQNISKLIENKIKFDIQIKLNHFRNLFIFYTISIIFSTIAFILMIVAFFKLARNEQRLNNIMNKYIISSTTDTKGIIIDASEAFCKISGYSKKELIGKPHNIVRHPDMPNEIFKKLWHDISRGKNWSGKIKNRKKDGGFYWVYANIEPLFTNKGDIDSYIAIRLDITESEILQLKYEEQAKKSLQKEKLLQEQSRFAQMGEMMSMIAHQWRQPLNTISAACTILDIKANTNKIDQENILEISDKIKNLTQHLSKTIDDFRDFFKPTKEKKRFTYDELISSTLRIVEISLNNKNIKIIQDLQSKMYITTYFNELKQVLINLLKNAEDAIVDNKIKKPYIRIVTKENKLIVSDNAGGIPQDIISKIFDPYFSTKKLTGTGLGLYMSKTIVEEHCGGKLNVSNDKDGAVFTIVL